MYCSTCGSKTIEGAQFCSACGAVTEPEPHAADAPPDSTVAYRQDVASEEPPSKGAVPVHGDGRMSLSRVWLISGAVGALVLLVVAVVFASGRNPSDTAMGNGGTLPAASLPEEPETDSGTPEVAEQGNATDASTNVGGNDEGNPASEPTTTLSTETVEERINPVATLADAFSGALDPTWAWAPYDEATFRGNMTSVAAWGPGFVAVDAVPAGVWLSEDGYQWRRIPYDEATFGLKDQSRGLELGETGTRTQMSAVVEFADGLVAVGLSQDVKNTGDQFYQAVSMHFTVWVSDDGLDWTRIQVEPATRAFPPILDLAVYGGLLVGVGYSDFISGDTARSWLATIWTSRDGIDWTRVPRDDDVLGTRSDQITLHRVAAGAQGLVAIGAAPNVEDARLLYSPNGIDWERLSTPEQLEYANDVVAFENGFLVVARGIWYSPEGYGWTKILDPEEMCNLPDEQDCRFPDRISVTDRGIVASTVGFNQAWLSSNGRDWQYVQTVPREDAVPPAVRIRDLVASGDRLVAVGSSDANEYLGQSGVLVAELGVG